MGKKKLGTLLAGVGIGVGLGMLFSPKSGKENREDLKNASKKAVQKIKDIDLNEVKDNLIKDYNKLVKEVKTMDKEKALKYAKAKGKEISEKATELITLAKEKSEPVIADATKDLKKKLSEFLADLSEKLED